MNTNINLLLHTDEESLKRERRIRILNLAAAASLVIVGLISLGLFVSIQVVNPASIKKEQSVILGKMSQLQSRQAKLFVLNNRVENIDNIFRTRKDLSKATEEILAKVPSQLSIENFEIDTKSVVITGQSRSLFAIGELINNLTDMVRKKEIIKSLTLNSLVLEESKNTYQISIKSEM